MKRASQAKQSRGGDKQAMKHSPSKGKFAEITTTRIEVVADLSAYEDQAHNQRGSPKIKGSKFNQSHHEKVLALRGVEKQ